MDVAQQVKSLSQRTFFVCNAVISTAAVAVIAVILLRGRTSPGAQDLSFMPALNAASNALAALCLVFGFVAIRRKAVRVHRACMVAAFIFSTLFLVGYLTYHLTHGDTAFAGHGLIRVVYFCILITHIILSVTVVPLALTAFYFALSGAFEQHRRLNRVFLPIWLSVSVTGVLIFFLLRA